VHPSQTAGELLESSGRREMNRAGVEAGSLGRSVTDLLATLRNWSISGVASISDRGADLTTPAAVRWPATASSPSSKESCGTRAAGLAHPGKCKAIGRPDHRTMHTDRSQTASLRPQKNPRSPAASTSVDLVRRILIKGLDHEQSIRSSIKSGWPMRCYGKYPDHFGPQDALAI